MHVHGELCRKHHLYKYHQALLSWPQNLYRLAFLSLMLEEDQEAQRYLGIADELIVPPAKPEGFRGIVEQLFQTPIDIRLEYLVHRGS